MRRASSRAGATARTWPTHFGAVAAAHDRDGAGPHLQEPLAGEFGAPLEPALADQPEQLRAGLRHGAERGVARR